MKLNDIKHNHSLTDLLKILIFAILIMIPFIDVGVRCLYVICNKNAYQSYYGETINEQEVVNINPINMKIGQTYEFTNSLLIVPQETYNTTTLFITDLVDNQTNESMNADRLKFYKYQTYYMLEIANDSTTVATRQLNNVIVDYSFTYQSRNNDNWLTFLKDYFYETQYNSYSYLDNVFDYSVNKLTTSELYTWTQQTAIFTGVQTMTTQLGINNTVIPILLVYWFILTVIYIIIDIILKLFTILTHAIGSKTA